MTPTAYVGLMPIPEDLSRASGSNTSNRSEINPDKRTGEASSERKKAKKARKAKNPKKHTKIMKYDANGNLISMKKVKIDEFGNPIKKKKIQDVEETQMLREFSSGSSQWLVEPTQTRRAVSQDSTKSLEDSISTIGLMSAAEVVRQTYALPLRASIGQMLRYPIIQPKQHHHMLQGSFGARSTFPQQQLQNGNFLEESFANFKLSASLDPSSGQRSGLQGSSQRVSGGMNSTATPKFGYSPRLSSGWDDRGFQLTNQRQGGSRWEGYFPRGAVMPPVASHHAPTEEAQYSPQGLVNSPASRHAPTRYEPRRPSLALPLPARVVPPIAAIPKHNQRATVKASPANKQGQPSLVLTPPTPMLQAIAGMPSASLARGNKHSHTAARKTSSASEKRQPSLVLPPSTPVMPSIAAMTSDAIEQRNKKGRPVNTFPKQHLLILALPPPAVAPPNAAMPSTTVVPGNTHNRPTIGKTLPAVVSQQPFDYDLHQLIVQYLISAGADPAASEQMTTQFEHQQQLGIETYAAAVKMPNLPDRGISHEIDKFTMFAENDESSVGSAIMKALAQGTARAGSEENELKYTRSIPPAPSGRSQRAAAAARTYSMPVAAVPPNSSQQPFDSDLHQLIVQYLISAGATAAFAEHTATQFEDQQKLGIDTYAASAKMPNSQDRAKSHDIDKFAMFAENDEGSVASAIINALAQGTARVKHEENKSKHTASMPPLTASRRSHIPAAAGRTYSMPVAAVPPPISPVSPWTPEEDANNNRWLFVQYLISVGTDPMVAEHMADQFEAQYGSGMASPVPWPPTPLEPISVPVTLRRRNPWYLTTSTWKPPKVATTDVMGVRRLTGSRRPHPVQREEEHQPFGIVQIFPVPLRWRAGPSALPVVRRVTVLAITEIKAISKISATGMLKPTRLSANNTLKLRLLRKKTWKSSMPKPPLLASNICSGNVPVAVC